MKNFKDILLNESIYDDDEQLIVLSPDELKIVLDFIKGKEDKGLCLRYTANTDDEWYQFDACRFDERSDKGPKSWPWKKIIRKE